MLAFKTILFILIIPVWCLGAVPVWLIQTTPVLFSFGLFHCLAFPLLRVGWAIIIWCCWNFTVQGHGMPNPFDPPRELVVVGLYYSVRNPIYIGAAIVLIGCVFWSPSQPILLMQVICFTAASSSLGITRNLICGKSSARPMNITANRFHAGSRAGSGRQCKRSCLA